MEGCDSHGLALPGLVPLATVHYWPSPFGDTRLRIDAQPGERLSDVIERARLEGIATYGRGTTLRTDLRVWVGASRLEPECWSEVCLTGEPVNIRVVPAVEWIVIAAIAAWEAVSAVVGLAITGLQIAGAWGLGLVGIQAGGVLGSGLLYGLVEIGVGILIVGGAGYSVYSAFRGGSAPQTPRLAGGSLGGGSSGGGGSGRGPSDSPTVAGTRNAERPYDPIWTVSGKHRITPPIVGREYTEIIGGVQYLNVLFGWYGPCRTTDWKLGETDIFIGGLQPLYYPSGKHRSQTDLPGPGKKGQISNFNGVSYEVLEGWSDDPPIELYPARVTQERLNKRLHGQKPQSSTGWQAGATTTNTAKIQLEISFPAGLLAFNADGTRGDIEMPIQVQFREKDSGDPWVSPTVGDADYEHDFKIEAKQAGGDEGATAKRTGDGKFTVNSHAGAFHIGCHWVTLDPAKQWEVRVRVAGDGAAPADEWEGPPGTEAQFSGQCFWGAIASIEWGNPVAKPGLSLIALRIKASNQLAGYVDTFSVLAESYLPHFTTGVGWSSTYAKLPPISEKSSLANGKWSRHPSVARNAAWAYANVLRGDQQGESISDAFLDVDGFAAWAAANVASGRYFDAALDFGGATYNLMRDIAGAARATPHVSAGWKIGALFERDTRGESVVALVTPANTIQAKFLGSIDFPAPPDYVRARFISEAANYESDEIVVPLPGGPVGERYEEDEVWGVVDATEVWKIITRRLAENIYRREGWVVQMGIENLAFQRGDLVGFSHDVPLIGISYGRLAAGSTTTVLRLAEPVTMEHGQSYGVSLWTSGKDAPGAGGIVRESRALVNPATPGEPVTTATITLASALAEAPPGEGVFAFGIAGYEHRRCIVRSLVPGPNMTATVELVDEGDEIWDAEGGEAPPYDPGITPGLEYAPAAPEFFAIEGHAEAGEIHVWLRPGNGGAVPTDFELQWRLAEPGEEDTSTDWVRLQPFKAEGDTKFIIEGVVGGRYYDLRARSIGGRLGLPGPWTYVDDWHLAGVTDWADAFRITGLTLAGAAEGDYEFEGPEVEIEWRLNSPLFLGDEILDPQPGAGTLTQETANPYIRDYEVLVLDPRDPNTTTSAPLRRSHVTSRRWRYTLAQQQQDARLLERDRIRWLRIGVCVRDNAGNRSPYAWIEIQNPPATITSATIGTSGSTVWADVIRVEDNDLAGIRLYAVTAGTPITSLEDFAAADLKVDVSIASSPDAEPGAFGSTMRQQVLWAGAPDGSWDVYLVAYDQFGIDALSDASAILYGPTPVVVVPDVGGVHRDGVFYRATITAIGADYFAISTVDGPPFSSGTFPDSKVVGAYMLVTRIDENDPRGAALHEVYLCSSWDEANGRLYTAGAISPEITTTYHGMTVYRADIDDGVVNRLHIEEAIIGTLYLEHGAVTVDSVLEADWGAGRKARKDRWTTVISDTIDVSGDEGVMIDAQVEVGEPAENQDANGRHYVALLREIATATVDEDAPLWYTLNVCESATYWYGDTVLTYDDAVAPIADASHKAVGTYSILGWTDYNVPDATFPKAYLHLSLDAGGGLANLDCAGTVIRFWAYASYQGAFGLMIPNYYVYGFRVYAHQAGYPAAGPRRWWDLPGSGGGSPSDLPVMDQWQQIELDLGSTPTGEDGGAWDGADIGGLTFEITYWDFTGRTTGINVLMIDEIQYSVAATLWDVPLTGLAPMTSVAEDEWASSEGDEYVVIVRPAGLVPPEENNPDDTMEMVRQIVANSSGTAPRLTVGAAAGTEKVWPKASFGVLGYPRDGDAVKIFKVIRAHPWSTKWTDTAQLRCLDAPPNINNDTSIPQVTEYRVIAKRDTLDTNIPYLRALLEMTKVKR